MEVANMIKSRVDQMSLGIDCIEYPASMCRCPLRIWLEWIDVLSVIIVDKESHTFPNCKNAVYRSSQSKRPRTVLGAEVIPQLLSCRIPSSIRILIIILLALRCEEILSCPWLPL